MSNDELRQRFIDQTVPQADYLGLKIPDPECKWNAERGHYDIGPIDWDEFYGVIKGNGPCNRDRMATRINAWEDGAWVREAALAHAEKRGVSGEQGHHVAQRQGDASNRESPQRGRQLDAASQRALSEAEGGARRHA